ncbi:hypothetical protein ACQ4PT_010584 [Festuca glaucescens]
MSLDDRSATTSAAGSTSAAASSTAHQLAPDEHRQERCVTRGRRSHRRRAIRVDDALSAAVRGRPERDDERSRVGVVGGLEHRRVERGRVGFIGELARSTLVGITAGQEARWSSTARVPVSIWMRAKRQIDPPSHAPMSSRSTRFPAAAPFGPPPSAPGTPHVRRTPVISLGNPW